MKYIIFFILSVAHLYALVSISPVEISENPGFTGTISGSFDTKRGNTHSDNYSAGIKLTYDNDKTYLMWGEFNFSYGEANGDKNTNKTYLHFRYIRKMRDNLDWELFIQSETNEFTQMEERFLSGGGVRLHLNKITYGNLYFGLGSFYEYINYSTLEDPKERNIRMNLYLKYKKDFSKNSQLSYVLYYQPKFGDINDYVIVNALELKILIYEKLYIGFNISYNKDAKPATGVKRIDFQQTTALTYKF